MHGRFLACLVSVFVFGAAGFASAANVTSFNPQSLVLALQNAGYKAILSKDDEGDPLIETASDGNPIVIVMTDCENHSSCATTEFVGVWDCSKEIKRCGQVAEEYNNEESPVHALMSDDGERASTYAYLLFDEVGISESLFLKNFTTFSYYNNRFTLEVSRK